MDKKTSWMHENLNLTNHTVFQLHFSVKPSFSTTAISIKDLVPGKSIQLASLILLGQTLFHTRMLSCIGTYTASNNALHQIGYDSVGLQHTITNIFGKS